MIPARNITVALVAASFPVGHVAARNATAISNGQRSRKLAVNRQRRRVFHFPDGRDIVRVQPANERPFRTQLRAQEIRSRLTSEMTNAFTRDRRGPDGVVNSRVVTERVNSPRRRTSVYVR